jgi:hypothetical protein
MKASKRGSPTWAMLMRMAGRDVAPSGLKAEPGASRMLQLPDGQEMNESMSWSGQSCRKVNGRGLAFSFPSRVACGRIFLL